MAVTGQKVYELALTLIDEVTETGNVVADNPDYYKTKAKNFITMLQTELLPFFTESTVLDSLDNDVKVTDYVALTVLPYGVAAQLLLHENINVSSFFNDTYQELKRTIVNNNIEFETIFTIEG